MGTPLAVASVIASTAGIDARYVRAHPQAIVVPLVIAICSAAYLAPASRTAALGS